MSKESSENKLKRIRAEYEQYYDIQSINSPNDSMNLSTLIRNAALIESIQDEMDTLAGVSVGKNVTEITKLNTALGNLIEKNVALERALGIDRKSRRSETTKDNPAEYILQLKASARKFLESRLEKLYCPECKVMVMRYSAVHGHTPFDIRVQCSQCQKWVIATRKERDIFYDLKAADREWRRAFPVTIIQPRKTVVTDVEDDVVLGADEPVEDMEE